MEQFFDPQFLLGALKRRWWLILLPAVIITPLVAGIAYILPATYQSTARILVEAPQIPENLAQSTVRVGIEQRVALIEQRLMTRENLLDLARRFNITRTTGPMSPTETVEFMRGATSIRGVRYTQGGPVSGVNISFTSSSPVLAAQVANEFLELLLQQNVAQRTGRALQTSDYFRQETERLAVELAEREAALTQFKIDNEAALPESLPFRREELARLQQQVFERELQAVALQDQKKQILEALQRGDLDQIGREPTPEEVELARLRRALVQQRTTYSDNHPLVRSLTTRIAALEERVAADLTTHSVDEAERRAGEEETVQSRVERMLGDLDRRIEQLDARRTEEQARIARLEASIEATPSVELELSQRERELGVLQVQYRDTVLKRAQAETGERLEVTQQAERFEVIERAEIPPMPTSPNRPLIAGAGAVGSLGIGFALALLAELLNRSVRSVADLERSLNLRPIVVIPYIPTQSEIRRRKLLLRAILLTVVIVIPSVLFLLDQYYLPLPLLAQRLVDASGIGWLLSLIEARFGS